MKVNVITGITANRTPIKLPEPKAPNLNAMRQMTIRADYYPRIPKDSQERPTPISLKVYLGERGSQYVEQWVADSVKGRQQHSYQSGYTYCGVIVAPENLQGLGIPFQLGMLLPLKFNVTHGDWPLQFDSNDGLSELCSMSRHSLVESYRQKILKADLQKAIVEKHKRLK